MMEGTICIHIRPHELRLAERPLASPSPRLTMPIKFSDHFAGTRSFDSIQLRRWELIISQGLSSVLVMDSGKTAVPVVWTMSGGRMWTEAFDSVFLSDVDV